MYFKVRKDFKDIDVNKVSRILYEPYLDNIPKATDYKRGEERTIVLKNLSSGELEQIRYRLTGAVPFSDKPGFYWYYGEVNAEDYKSVLAFYFNGDGSLRSISVSFCGGDPTDLDFSQTNRSIRYAAEFTKALL